ncbi:MAG: DNA repair protein RadC [Alphaproteobacteria bacterium]|nr:DNA repair protein RadC [Alphaproteobacteria bacterium]
MPEAAPKHHEGHRARLKSRFLDAGPQALADYELLELLLFMAIPRRDVKPLAKALLARFGDIGAVFAAQPHDMLEVEGMTDGAVVALKAIDAAAARIGKAAVANKPVFSSYARVLDYCTTVMAREKVEQFRVLYLNRKNMLEADEVHQQGTVDQSAVFPREIVKRALAHGATAIILVHNHPSGDPTPSDADIELTGEIVRAMDPLGIVVHDHLIIARNGHTSFKKQGLL